MNLVFLGPPGSGKGTQAARLAEAKNLKHLSTGEILRDSVSRQTEIGKEAQGYMNRGELVPDHLILGMIERRIQRGEIGSGFILDGFPRTIPQAEAFTVMLEEDGITLDKAVLFEVANDVIIRRMSGRRFCPQCSAGYNLNLEALKPKVENICDNDGTELKLRNDDEESTVRNRLVVYHNQTKPIVDYYRKQSLLVEINAQVAPDVVFRALLSQVS